MPLAGVLTSVLVVAYLVDRRLLLRRQVRQLPQRVWLLPQQGLEGVRLRGDVEVELEVVEHGGFWLVAEGKLGSAGSALLDFCVHEAVASSFRPIPGIGFVVVDLVCLLAILFLLLDVFYDLAELLLELRGFFALLGLFGLFDDFLCVLFEGELPEQVDIWRLLLLFVGFELNHRFPSLPHLRSLPLPLGLLLLGPGRPRTDRVLLDVHGFRIGHLAVEPPRRITIPPVRVVPLRRLLELDGEYLDEVLDDDPEGVVHVAQLPGDDLSMFLGDHVVDGDVHVAVHHLVGVDLAEVHDLWRLLLLHGSKCSDQIYKTI